MISYALAIRTAEAALAFDEVCCSANPMPADLDAAARQLRAHLDEYREAKAQPDVTGELVFAVEELKTVAG